MSTIDKLRFDTSRFLLSGESGLTPTLRAPWAMQRRTAGAFYLASAHIGGERLFDELLQRLRLLLFRDGAYDGVTHDIAVAVNHLGGGVGKNVCSELSRLTI